MNQNPVNNLLQAIANLDDRLELTGDSHRREIADLRTELAMLEQRVLHELQPVPPPLPDETARVMESEAAFVSLPASVPLAASTPVPLPAAAPPPPPKPPPSPPGRSRLLSAPAPKVLPQPSSLAAAPPRLPEETLEQRFGQIWTVRIGIVLLLTGLVLGANWAYHNWVHNLPAGVRLAGLYACSALLGGAGWHLARKELYKRYGEVLVAGGMAFFYYCTYAAHQVGRLRVIESPVTGAVLLTAAAGLIAAVSWIRQSRLTATMGIVLASYATMIQPLDWLSSISNLLLAATGIALMLRPRWGAPGIASLAGTYAAFGGWQLLGAAGQGHGDTRATLWFLGASWAIFAIPGMLGRFRESLGDYGRAVFTAANNALFFSMFSWLWLAHYGADDFWKTPAVFGSVLLALGAAGRRREDNAAASNVIQGLALLSLALVLKLQGWHLALALAGESLAMALAFHRFQRRPEFITCVVSGLVAAALTVNPLVMEHGVPLWSGLLAALLVMASGLVVRFNVDRILISQPGAEARKGAAMLLFASLAMLICGWVMRVPAVWQLPLMAGLSAIFAVLSIAVDKRRWLVEVAWASGICGVLSMTLLGSGTTLAGFLFALAAGLVSCACWHRPREESTPRLSKDPADMPWFFAWQQALFVPLVLTWMAGFATPDPGPRIGIAAVGAVSLVAIARCLQARRLEITASFLNAGTLLLILEGTVGLSSHPSQAAAFMPAAAAAGIAAIVRLGRSAPPRVQMIVARATLFISWTVALYQSVPHGFTDLMALSAAAVFALAWKRRETAPLMAWGWLAVSSWAYARILVEGTTSPLHGYPMEGIALLAACCGIALFPPKVAPARQKDVEKVLPWLACAMVTVWTTHLVVAGFGWSAVSVLWTILGFSLVSFGLVLKRLVSRQAGFSLLALALLKLFCADVWDFSTAMRIVSFIALGLALVVLGLFYHRFAPAVKRLLDDGQE